MSKFILLLSFLLFQLSINVSSASISDASKPTSLYVTDVHSFSNFDEIQVTHTNLDLTFNFSEKKIEGEITLFLDKKKPKVSTLILDTMLLSIKSVKSKGIPLSFRLGKYDYELGSPLHIDLKPNTEKITIKYESKNLYGSAFWGFQSSDRSFQEAYFYNLIQPIGARSLFPLQDTPQVRFTYESTLRVPKGLSALMGATRQPSKQSNIFKYKMDQSIPSYLLGIVIGNYQFRKISERTGVYASTSYISSAAKEFNDIERILRALEKTYGAYRWQRQDIVVMPYSFPINGMEYPRLSFLSPFLIDGHKSSALILAHEIAHAWAGNLVSVAKWEDLWLSETFAHYLAYRAIETVYGYERYKTEISLGYKSIVADFQHFSETEQVLDKGPTSQDAGDFFNNTIYEKGPLLLREIELRVGRDAFDRFLKQYFKEFAFKAVTTEQFLNYTNTHLISQFPEKLSLERIEQWVYEAGIPEHIHEPHSTQLNKVDIFLEQWKSRAVPYQQLKQVVFSIQQQLYFLARLPEDLTANEIAELDAIFSFSSSPNHQVINKWFVIGIDNWHRPTIDKAVAYIYESDVYLEDLFDALYETAHGSILADEICEELENCL